MARISCKSTLLVIGCCPGCSITARVSEWLMHIKAQCGSKGDPCSNKRNFQSRKHQFDLELVRSL